MSARQIIEDLDANLDGAFDSLEGLPSEEAERIYDKAIEDHQEFWAEYYSDNHAADLFRTGAQADLILDRIVREYNVTSQEVIDGIYEHVWEHVWAGLT